MSNRIKLYDLRTDNARALQLENSFSSNGEKPSLSGGIGSPDWWAAIEIGRVTVQVEELIVEDCGLVDGVKMWEEPDFMLLIKDKSGKSDWQTPPFELGPRQEEVKPGDKLTIKSVADPRSPYQDITIEIWREGA